MMSKKSLLWLAVVMMSGCALENPLDVGQPCEGVSDIRLGSDSLCEGSSACDNYMDEMQSGYCPREFGICMTDGDVKYCSKCGETEASIVCGEKCIDPNTSVEYCGAKGDCSSESINDENWKGFNCENILKNAKKFACENGECVIISCDSAYTFNGRICCQNVNGASIAQDSSTTCSVRCNDGYESNGNICCAVNDNKKILKDNADKCNYECAEGFVTSNCCKPVEHAEFSETQDDPCHFECEDGYIKSFDGQSCVSQACNDGEVKCLDAKLYKCNDNKLELIDVCMTNVGNASAKCASETECGGYDCDNGYSLCDGACYNLSSDMNHCGSCTNSCPASLANGKMSCMDGKCVTVCNSNYTNCDGECYNLDADKNHCGSCSNACTASVSNGSQVCRSGSCGIECKAGYTECGGACYNLSNDKNHCGNCETSCPSSLANGSISCVDGSCEKSCNSPFTLCGDSCYMLSVDKNHCGSCTKSCSTSVENGYEDCISGTCVRKCNSGYELSDGVCVKTTYTVTACGSGSFDCTSAKGWGSGSCKNGICDASSCKTGYYKINIHGYYGCILKTSYGSISCNQFKADCSDRISSVKCGDSSICRYLSTESNMTNNSTYWSGLNACCYIDN